MKIFLCLVIFVGQSVFAQDQATAKKSQKEKVLKLTDSLQTSAADYYGKRRNSYGYGYGYSGQPGGAESGAPLIGSGGGLGGGFGGMNPSPITGMPGPSQPAREKSKLGYPINTFNTYDYTNTDPSQWRDDNYYWIRDSLISETETPGGESNLQHKLTTLFVNDLTKDKNARSYLTALITERRINPNAMTTSEKPENYPGMGLAAEKNLACSLFNEYAVIAMMPMDTFYNVNTGSAEKIGEEQNQLLLQNAIDITVENRLDLNQKCSNNKTPLKNLQDALKSNYLEEDQNALFGNFIKELTRYSNDLKKGATLGTYQLAGNTANKINLPGSKGKNSADQPILIRTPFDNEQTRVCFQADNLCITAKYATTGCKKEERDNIYTTNFSSYLARAKAPNYKPTEALYFNSTQTCQFNLTLMADKNPVEFQSPAERAQRAAKTRPNPSAKPSSKPSSNPNTGSNDNPNPKAKSR